MDDKEKIAKILETLQTAETSIALAKEMMGAVESIPESAKISTAHYASKATDLSASEGGRIIEGVFDGQAMTDSKGTTYPVPANYASKSKLIPGDVLKLTVTEEGKFLYKQIGPVERKTAIGPLVHNDGQYQVLADGKSYHVLLASVTYFRAHIGDEITIIIPSGEDSKWAAIEAVLPKFNETLSIVDDKTDDLDIDIDNDLDI